ncbi:hypothetical protein GCM10023174_04920 [Chelativorans composti]
MCEGGASRPTFFCRRVPRSPGLIQPTHALACATIERQQQRRRICTFSIPLLPKNPRATELEKRQARLEMTIAEKKLAFWSRHPNFDKEEAMRGVEALKRAWGSGERAA